MHKRLAGLLASLTAAGSLVVVLDAPAQAATFVTVVSWADGDSLMTSVGEVRLIGVDTPEVGTCGADAAKALAERLAPPGTRIRLGNPGSVKDIDQYGRLLRFVNVRKVDIGRRQIAAGAKARYDGKDGYQKHPRQGLYRRVDRKNADYPCAAPAGGGAHTPADTNNCPSNAPIKGNQGSNGWIYHQPGQQYYGVTNPEQCFATASDAEAAGYRAAKV